MEDIIPTQADPYKWSSLPQCHHSFVPAMASRWWVLAATLLSVCGRAQSLQTYDGPPPQLRDRSPFGFGKGVTGGGTPTSNSTYLVDNMIDLRTVLKIETPRTVYVKGNIYGNQLPGNMTGNCQYYIDNSTVPKFNFTKYIQAQNTSYMAEVKAAASAGVPFEGQNATDLLSVLNRQNGWRGTAQNVQKSWESIDARGNLTLIGFDATASLIGVSLIFNTRSNVIIRNLSHSPPRDCFPAPESYPRTWNARYDAVSLVTTNLVWLDGNSYFDSPTGPVAPDPLIWGWEVDRYDGLVDVEDGSDNITFSHNVVANHHKSLLWGGGEKEGPRDIGKMRFTVFGNHFHNSLSRNPLMRFGTFYVVGNLFENRADQPPQWGNASVVPRQYRELVSSEIKRREEGEAYVPDFQYNLGIYNLSSVLVSSNAFRQTGLYPSDTTRIFAFSNLATPDTPARFCSPDDSKYTGILNGLAGSGNDFNDRRINLTQNVEQSFKFYVDNGKSNTVAGGLRVECDRFPRQEMPVSFTGGKGEVESYVREHAGASGGMVV